LLKGGVTLVNALEIASRVAIHPKIQKNLLEVAEKVKEGKLIAPSLEEEGVYPSLFVSMISVGEQSGELEKMLIKIADFYEKESASKLQTLVSLVEPILIIVIGLIVLLVVFAVITPIVEMISILKF
jgi:general secretion pathway protein F